MQESKAGGVRAGGTGGAARERSARRRAIARAASVRQRAGRAARLTPRVVPDYGATLMEARARRIVLWLVVTTQLLASLGRSGDAVVHGSQHRHHHHPHPHETSTPHDAAAPLFAATHPHDHAPWLHALPIPHPRDSHEREGCGEGELVLAAARRVVLAEFQVVVLPPLPVAATAPPWTMPAKSAFELALPPRAQCDSRAPPRCGDALPLSVRLLI
jgi:hypothetical protein